MKHILLALMLAALLLSLTGCFIQPDPTLEPLTISEGTIPFGTVQSLPTNTPTHVPAATPTPTPNSWSASDQSTWEDWSRDALPTTTPRTAATAAPDAQSWQTSTQDYNAGYPVLRVGSTGSDVSDLQARLYDLGYYTGTIDGKYASGTQEAVTEFQSRNGLTADGIAGRQTQDLLYSASAQPKVISTSGGTGVGPRDISPQVTSAVLDYPLPGFSMAMMQASLAKTPHAAISRAVAGVLGQSIIINLPGSRKAVVENLEAVLPALPHALDKLHGDPADCGG